MRIGIALVALMALLPATAFGQTFTVNIDGTDHVIDYTGMGVVVLGANLDMELLSLELELSVTTDPGTLTLNLSREFLSGLHGSADEEFEMIADASIHNDFDQTSTEAGKILDIQLDAGTDELDIVMLPSDTPAAEPVDQPATPEPPPIQELSGTIQIGALLPITGDFSSHTPQNNLALVLAADELNRHLETSGEPWSIEVLPVDTESDPDTALERLEGLHAQGVRFIVGPETSASITRIQDYVESNNILVVSCCSTSPTLSIPDDNIFRLIPDDDSQAAALAQLVSGDGLQAVIPVWRDDVWGNAWADNIEELFAQTVDDGINYPTGTTDFAEYTQILAQKAQNHADQHGPEMVGIMFMGFDEIVPFIQSAADHDILGDVHWYGTDANVGDTRIVEDPVTRDFAQETGFKALMHARADNPKSAVLDSLIQGEFGSPPGTYVHFTYDTLWILGLSIQEAQSADPQAVAEVLPTVAEEYVGAIGDIRLNDAGDRMPTISDIWNIQDGQWTRAGLYDYTTAQITGLAADDDIPDDTMQDDTTAPDDTMMADDIPDDTMQDDTMQDDTMQDDTMQDDTMQDDTMQDDTMQDDTMQDDTMQDDTMQDDTMQDDTMQDDTMQDDTMQDDTMQDDTMQDDTMMSNEVMGSDELLCGPGTEMIDGQCVPIRSSQGDSGWVRDIAAGGAGAFVIAFIASVLFWLISRASREKDPKQ